MAEEQPVRGDSWTKQARELLSDFGWTPRGDKSIDIPCCMPKQHKNNEGNPKREHGIDSFFTYHDPYQNREIGILAEAKHYAWRGTTKAFLQETVDDLIEKIECASLSEEFYKKLDRTNAKLDTGILMIWNHDDFHKDKFENHLIELKIRPKHNNIRIYILNNYDILKLYSIRNEIQNINGELKGKGKFDFYYPSHRNNDAFRGQNFLGLEYFKSKFIFAKMVKIHEHEDGACTPINYTIVFYFDKMTFPCLNYMYLALRNFQLTGNNIRIYHIENPLDSRSDIAEFKHKYDTHDFKIDFCPMVDVKTVPWRL